MANLVTQSLKILNKATMTVGKEYTSNLTAFVNDAKDVKNTIMNAGTDAADTYAKLKRTNITKAIHDWFYQEESDSEMEINTGKDEFDAGFSSDDTKLDGESSGPTVLSSDAMANISNKQTNAIIKVGRRQTEQSVANTAEIVSSLNSRSAEMLTAVNNINKTLLGISSRLDKIIELQAVPLTTQQQEIDKGGLYQDGKLSLMRIFEQAKNSVTSSGPMSFLQLGIDALREGSLGPSALAAMGVKGLAQKIKVNGKSFDDWGTAFNEMIGTATQTFMNEMVTSKTFQRLFPGLTKLDTADKDYGSVVPVYYDTKRAQFDGMTRMSIVNIIPEMLAKINQSISGQEYHLDGRGKWIAGPVKNEFAEMTRASFQSGGLTAKMSSRISNAGVQSIGKKIPSEDIKDASEALTMAMVIKLHHDGDRAFSASRIKTELAGQIDNAVAVLALMGRGDEEYWYKVCQTIVLQLSSGMLDSASFVTNINQSLQKMIKDATDFAQSGKANASQASKITLSMAANQFLATHGAPAPTGSNNINANGTLLSANGSIANPGQTLGKFSTGQYVSGIFYLLNRGINVRIDKDADKYEAITLAQVRPDAKPYVSDDTFGKMLKKGLSGKASKLDNVAKDSVKKQMSGSDNTPSGLISKFLSSPAMALTALSNLFKSGPGALLDKAKDKAKGFLGEERYNAVADKLGSLKDRVIGDERYQNLKANAQEKLDALKDKASEAGNKIGHTRVVNNMAYAADSLKLRSAEDTAAHYKSDDEHDNIRAAAIKGLCEKGKFDIAEEYLDKIKNPTIRQAFQDIVDINKKRKRGEEAVENGEEADIGSVLMQRVNPEDDDGKVDKDESQRSILGRMLGMVGRIAKGVAKLAARGAIDLTMGLKSMAQGLLLGYKDVDAEGNVHKNKGLIRNLTTVPMGAMAKGAKKAVGAVATGVKNALTNDEGESIVSKGFKTVRGLLNKLLDGIGAFKDMVKDRIGGALDKLKGSKFGQAVGKAASALGNNKFMRGFTSGFKDAKAARDKLLNAKKREEDASENPLRAEQTEMMEGKKPSIFTKIHELLLGISGSVTHQEEIAEDEAKKQDKEPTGNPDVGNVLNTNNIRNDDDNDGGGSKGGGILSGIKGVIGDIMGDFGKMMGGMTQALLGIGEMVISIVTSLESFGALKDMVQSILVDGLQPLNEAFDAIMEAIKPLVDTLKGMVTMIAKVVVNIAKSLIDVVQPIIEAIMPIIQTVIDLLSPILKIIEVLMNVIMIPIKIAMDIISPVIEGIGYTLQVVSGVLQIGLGAVMGLLGAIVAGIGLVLSFMPGSVGDKGDELKATGEGMLEMSKTMLKAGAEQIKQGIQGGIALIQRLLPGGKDGKEEEPEKDPEYEDKRKAQLSDTEFGSGDVTTINNSYSYTYGSGNTTMNQHSYGGYMNMSERGCGPVALADAYGRRTGANINPAMLAASMNGAGQYDTHRGTSVASMVNTGNAMGMGMRVGGVTAASIRQASPTNPITVLGSGQGFGTRSGNNHYVNVVGTDRHGGAYVSNPMTGRVDRQSMSSILLNSKLGLYGSGDENEYEEYGFSDEATESLTRLKEITNRLTTMFTGESDAEKKINDANAERKANEIKRTLGDDYDAVEQQAIAKLKEKYPDYTDEQIQKKLNSREGWRLISELGGQSAVDLYNKNSDLMLQGSSEVLAGYNSVTDKIKSITTASQDSAGTSITGAEMTPFTPINFTQPYLNQETVTFDDGTSIKAATGIGPRDSVGKQAIGYYGSPVHDFFNSDLVKMLNGGQEDLAYTNNGWFNKLYGPQTAEGVGSSGKEHEAVLIHFGTKRKLPAITGGTVTYVTKDEDSNGLGKSVKWRDSGGMYHWYMHMDLLDRHVKEGANLNPGDPVGYAGNTGDGENYNHPVIRYLVTSAGPQGNTGDPGYINPFTYWQFKSGGNMSGDTKEEQTYTYLVSSGMTPVGAAGLMGCFKHESNFQYDNLENVYQDMMGYPAGEAGDAQYAADVDSKKESRENFISGRNLTYYANQKPGSAVGFGIAQFTSPDLKTSLYDNTVAKGKSITDIPSQLDEVMNVLKERNVYDMINSANTPEEANKLFLWRYEAGTNYNSDEAVLADYPWMLKSVPDGAKARHASAREYYEKYKNANVVQGTSSSATGKFIGSTTNPNAFASQDGYFSSDGGAALADYGVPTITKTNIDGTYSGNSPLHEFFSKTGGNGKAYSSNENWYEKRLNPNSEGVGRTDSSLGYHGGIDINWDTGSADKELHATTGGTVDGITTSGSAGNSVKWLDKAGYLHWYMHMRDKPLVNDGDTIKPGQLLGYVGNTGDSGGAHLHYSIINGSQFNGWSDSPGGVNPLMYFHNYNSAGPQTNPNERGGLTFSTGVRGASESGKTVQAIQAAGGMANYVKQLTGSQQNTNIKKVTDIWDASQYPTVGLEGRRDALETLVDYYNRATDRSSSYFNADFNTSHGRDYWDFETGQMTVDDLNNWIIRNYVAGDPRDNVQTFLSDLKKAQPFIGPVVTSDTTPKTGSHGGGSNTRGGTGGSISSSGHHRGGGDVPSSWYDALFNTGADIVATTDVPPVDESKLNDDAGLNALQQYTNKYNIKADDSRTTDMLNKLGSMTFNVRAKRVEELLEILINKVDGAPTDQPLPNMFDDEIPDAVTRLSIG